MKQLKIFLLGLTMLFCLTTDSYSQQVVIVNPAKATLTNTDTTYIKVDVPDDAKSIQIVVKRNSGTAAGRAVLLASNDGVSFEAFGADTLTFSNKATNSHLWKVNNPDYGQYYIELISSGTTNLSPKAYMIRRRW